MHLPCKSFLYRMFSEQKCNNCFSWNNNVHIELDNLLLKLMWDETGGGVCRAHQTPVKTQNIKVLEAQFNANEKKNLNGTHLEKITALLVQTVLRHEASMEEVSNGCCQFFKMNTGTERRVCVPALCSSSVPEHPLGAPRRSLLSGSLANWG